MSEMTLDHERCSELLGPYARNDLGGEERAGVEAHLAACADCRSELMAVQAVAKPVDEPLTELERTRLRREVLERAVPLPDELTAPAPQAGRSRLFQVLASAAVLAVIGGFAYLGLSGDFQGGDDSGADSATTEGAYEGAGRADPESVRDRGIDRRQAADAAAPLQAEGEEMFALAPPVFEPDAGVMTPRRLNRFGRDGLPLVAFSRSYQVADVAMFQADYIEQIASQAPTARGRDIRQCAAQVVEQFPNSLLSYAALADYQDRGNVFVLAFAWTDETSGPLDRSMVWAWSISGCTEVPVHYSTNTIRPRR